MTCIVRVVRFGLVGLAAAAVHYGVAISLVMLVDWSPQVANVGGYLPALLVSYHGQGRYTFRMSPKNQSRFWRFAATSFAGLMINAAGYAIVLHFTNLDYRIALGLVLIAAALLTYLALGRWVFDAHTRLTT